MYIIHSTTTKSTFVFAVILALNIAAASENPKATVKSSWQLFPLTDSEITATPLPSRGEVRSLIDTRIRTQALFAKLKGTDIKITFKNPKVIQAIGLMRPGWKVWAIPKVILVRVNNGKPFRVELSSPRVAPNVEKPNPSNIDIIALGTMVKTLNIKIVETESIAPYRTVGTLEIFGVAGCSATINLQDTHRVPADSSGLEFEFDLEKPIGQIEVKAVTGNRPMQKISAQYWSAVVNDLPAGRSVVNLPWEEFVNPTSPQWKLNPLNIFKFEIEQQRTTGRLPEISWRFIPGTHRIKPAWEEISPISHKADADGWRDGVPSKGFGRFGWTEDNGLLVGNLSMGKFSYAVVTRENKGREAVFDFHCGAADRQQKWDRLYVDWTGVVHQALYGKGAERTWADQKKKKKVIPMSLIYSILAPGFLVDSGEQKFSFGIADKNAGVPHLLYVSPKGLRWASAERPLKGEDMAEGWIVAVWPSYPMLPVMFAPKHRPTKIQAEKSTLVFDFSEGIGRIAIGTPSGFRWWNGQVGKPDEASYNLANRSRFLASILRAYPKTCYMQFKDETKSVLIKETFGHIVWENDWNETSKAIAPVSPLLSFAADMKYPLELPKNLKDSAIPTKVGPYRYAEGATVMYRLPLPPTAERIYLRPAGKNDLADYIAAKLTRKPAKVKNWSGLVNTDVYGYWFSCALALTLMDESQRNDFLASWKMQLEEMFKPYPWYVRTEPWSGAKYIYSFAWLSEAARTLGDINSGNGALLYSADLYAHASGDWDLIEKNWTLLNAVQNYYQMHHDWCYMQAPCHESTGDSAFDMDLIGYLGAVGYMRMAETLDKKDDAAIGRLFVARFAVPLCMRWLGARWVAPDLSRDGKPIFSSPGLTDDIGFVRRGQSSQRHVGLSLSWYGSTPEAFDCQLWGCGKDFWNVFEYKLLEKMQPPFRTEANYVCAHLYMRGLLGASANKLLDEIKRQKTLGLSPKTKEARKHATLYAMALGKEFPIRLRSWGRAALLQGTYDTAEGKAVLKFRCKRPFSIVLDLNKPVSTYIINGKKKGQLDAGIGVCVKLPAGEPHLELFFSKTK